MKFAVPSENGVLCSHFGHCRQFAIIDVDAESNNIVQVKVLNPPPHDIGVLPAWLHEIGCTHVIAGGMGGRAVALFQQNNIQVITGAQSDKPEQLVKLYLSKQLETGTNLCDDPNFKTHDHDDCGNH